jgi:hypothetical protein
MIKTIKTKALIIPPINAQLTPFDDPTTATDVKASSVRDGWRGPDSAESVSVPTIVGRINDDGSDFDGKLHWIGYPFWPVIAGRECR